MKREEIISKAKYIQFPFNNETYRNRYASVDAVRLPIVDGNVLYSDMPDNNKHHYTTKYTYEYVLPVVADMLGFSFGMNDFNLVECNMQWDISYIVPKREYEYELFCYTKDKHITGNYIELFNPVFFRTYTYRNLFRYPHTCSRIINKTLESDRKLMISGDSQMIPSINPLTNYFKEVWYFDNRTGYIKNEKTDEFEFHEDKFVSFSETYKDIDFTDVIVQLYCRDLKWYEYWNLY